jgi:hypothetical protein
MSATAEKLAYDDADGVLTAMRRGAAPVHMRGWTRSRCGASALSGSATRPGRSW